MVGGFGTLEVADETHPVGGSQRKTKLVHNACKEANTRFAGRCCESWVQLRTYLSRGDAIRLTQNQHNKKGRIDKGRGCGVQVEGGKPQMAERAGNFMERTTCSCAINQKGAS